MGKQTPFYQLHVAANAKMVDFAGWEMPLHYGSQLDEHHQVRKQAGFFDVSHMGVVDVKGTGVTAYLRYLLANNVDKLEPGKALYTCMLNEQGGVMDDLIVYKISDEFYRIVVNAGTREKDITWMKEKAGNFKLTFTLRTDLVMLAIQGPAVNQFIPKFLNNEQAPIVQALKPFTFTSWDDWFVAATGYTGEAGLEIIFPESEAESFWNKLIKAGIKPCGLGARDTLRLEAGLNLYGSDMDETVTPLESNLSWTVMFDPSERDFIGRSALEKQKAAGIKYRLVGLILEGPGIIRNHQKIYINGKSVGEVTSGGYAPTLERSIALARVPAEIGTDCFVEIRNKQVAASVVKPPFVKKGQPVYERNKA